MKTTQFLFPHKYKKVGWWILIPAIILGVLCMIMPDILSISPKDVYQFIHPTGGKIVSGHSDFLSGNLITTLTGILILIGGTFVGFSKNKEEDEFVEKIRFESLILAVYVNNIILLLCLIFVWGFDFLNVMIYNMFTTLLFFIFCFYLRLYLNKKTLKNEK